MTARDDDTGEPAADRARAEAQELAWREIVDNYGDAPDVAGLTELTTQVEPPEQPARPLEFRVLHPVFDPEAAAALSPAADDEDRFTPPPLPPPAVVPPDRRLAWVGLVLAPLLIIAIQMIDYPLPGILTFGLVVAFVVSFGYLVATMSPRDPDDDGARV